MLSPSPTRYSLIDGVRKKAVERREKSVAETARWLVPLPASGVEPDSIGARKKTAEEGRVRGERKDRAKKEEEKEGKKKTWGDDRTLAIDCPSWCFLFRAGLLASASQSSCLQTTLISILFSLEPRKERKRERESWWPRCVQGAGRGGGGHASLVRFVKPAKEKTHASRRLDVDWGDDGSAPRRVRTPLLLSPHSATLGGATDALPTPSGSSLARSISYVCSLLVLCCCCVVPFAAASPSLSTCALYVNVYRVKLGIGVPRVDEFPLAHGNEEARRDEREGWIAREFSSIFLETRGSKCRFFFSFESIVFLIMWLIIYRSILIILNINYWDYDFEELLIF